MYYKDSVLVEGLAWLVASIDNVRAERSEASLMVRDIRVLAGEGDNLYDRFNGEIPAGWAEVIAGMAAGVGLAHYFESVMRAMTVCGGYRAFARDLWWCAEELMLMVEIQRAERDEEPLTGDERERLFIQTSVMYDRMDGQVPGYWMDVVLQMCVRSVKDGEIVDGTLKVMEYLGMLGVFPEEYAVEEMVAGYLGPEPARVSEFVMMKVARDLSRREFVKPFVGEREYDDWMGTLRQAVSAEAEGDMLDHWLVELMDGCTGTSEPSAVYCWSRVSDEIGVAAADAEGLELLGRASAMFIDEEQGELSLKIDGDGGVALSFWEVWGIGVKQGFRRMLGKDFTVRLWDDNMKRWGDVESDS